MAGGGKASAATQAAATKSYEASPFKTYFFLFALILAYFAKYFCTSFLYVVQTLWRHDQGITHAQLAHQFIFGYVMSMIGKRAAGNWCDKYGGKKVQMLSLAVYIPIVILWSFGDKIAEGLGVAKDNHYYVFFTMWMFNGFFALGLSWVAIMVCASNWIPPHMEGRLLAVVGCAPELGDASARAFLGPIIKYGWGGFTMTIFGAAQTEDGPVSFGDGGDWRTVSLSAALAAIVLTLPMFLFVSESPLGYEEEKKKEQKDTGGTLDATLMTLTCTMCGLLYAIRTMFLLDSVTWLSQVYCHEYHPTDVPETCYKDKDTVGNVAFASLAFTFMGCLSVLLSGFTKDMIQKVNRGFILLINSFILLATILIMLIWNLELGFHLAVFLVGMIGFGDFGPYKTMSGAFAVDIGGKNRKGDVSAWMGVASNGAGAVILAVSGFLPDWSTMFKILIGLSIGCIACSCALISYDRKKYGSASARELLDEPLLE